MKYRDTLRKNHHRHNPYAVTWPLTEDAKVNMAYRNLCDILGSNGLAESFIETEAIFKGKTFKHHASLGRGTYLLQEIEAYGAN